MMDDSFYNFKRYDIIESNLEDSMITHWHDHGSLLVVTTDEYKVEEYQSLLKKILGAINANSSNTTIVQLGPEKSIKLLAVKAFSTCHSVICIGMNPKHLGLNFELNYFETKNASQRKWLFTPQLSALSEKVEYKKLLWAELKDHFALPAS